MGPQILFLQSDNGDDDIGRMKQVGLWYGERKDAGIDRTYEASGVKYRKR